VASTINIAHPLPIGAPPPDPVWLESLDPCPGGGGGWEIAEFEITVNVANKIMKAIFLNLFFIVLKFVIFIKLKRSLLKQVCNEP